MQNTSSPHQDCRGYKSLVISANLEFKVLSEKHLLAMMVDAMHLKLEVLSEPLESEANWEIVSSYLSMQGVDALVFACQECHWKENPVDKLFSETTMGKYFQLHKLTTDFTTFTKFPKPSKMFIGLMLPRDTRCMPRVVSVNQIHDGNKGAVMAYLHATSGKNIAFVGVHLDAKNPSQRASNIQMIMDELKKGHAGAPFSHVYIFGDLNYRLQAVPKVHDRCERCVLGYDTASDSKCSIGDIKSTSCKWCYDTDVRVGECHHQHSRCPGHLSLSTIYHKSKAKTVDSCKYYEADYDFYVEEMVKNRDRPMYYNVKEYDSLWEDIQSWTQRGYLAPDFLLDTPPTYKLKYCKKDMSAEECKASARNLYTLQTRAEQGSVRDPASARASANDLRSALRVVYDRKDGLKKCEFESKCMDFGWLDRLMIRGAYIDPSTSEEVVENITGAYTQLEKYQTAKIHPEFAAGDHMVLVMQMVSW